MSDIKGKELLINEEITAKEVRVISDDGEQLGVMKPADALRLAEGRDLDLVEIAPQAVPPVCKIMDYGKYRFEQSKREKEARKNQKVVDTKEIRLSVTIDTNDLNTKINSAIKFLKSGDKVKVSVRFRGRQMVHTSLGAELLDKFSEACSEYGTVDKPAKMEGRSLALFLAPKQSK